MGYIGNRMSERAFESYENGEKPWSKWKKEDFLDFLDEGKFPHAKKLTTEELRYMLLQNAGWHHTGAYFSETNFYRIDEEFLEKLTDEYILQKIGNRKPRKKREPKQKPLFCVAKIEYVEWVGKYRNYRRPETFTEIVKFMSNEKQVFCNEINKKKRLSSVTIIEKIERADEFANATELTTLTTEERAFFEEKEATETFEKAFGNCQNLFKDAGFNSYYEFILKANSYKRPHIFIKRCTEAHKQKEQERATKRLAYVESVLSDFDFRKLSDADIECFLKHPHDTIPSIQSIKDRSGFDSEDLVAFFKTHRTIENINERRKYDL